MSSSHSASFHTGTPLAVALRKLLEELEVKLALDTSLNVYIAGGMAVHLYTSDRPTGDVDAEFGGRIKIPNDLVVHVASDDGGPKTLYFDTNYNSTFALLHENYQNDAVPVDLGLTHLKVYVLSALDLAVSKIARFAPHDQADIRSLVRAGLTTADDIEKRAQEALGGFVGGQAMLVANIRDAVALARTVEATHSPTPPTPG